jgi:ribosomal RNA-processing protein 1
MCLGEILLLKDWDGFGHFEGYMLTCDRMDKFLYLVRQYLSASFSYFAKSEWKDTKRLNEYMDVLASTPLNPTDKRIPNGIRYHVIDIFVDELERVDEETVAEMPLEILLAPLRSMVKESPTKIVRERVSEALEDDRVRAWLGEEVVKDEEKAETKGNNEWGGIDG